MDLNGAIGKIKVGSCEVVEMPPVVRSLPTNEVQAAIKRVCFPGMHYPDTISAIGKLRSGGIPSIDLEANSEFIEQFISPESSVLQIGITKVIGDLERAYPGQVGTRPELYAPGKAGVEPLKNVFIPTWDNKPEPVPCVLSLGGVGFLNHQNSACLIASPGSGKSSNIEAIVASKLNPECDSLGWNVDPACRGIIVVDGEMPDTDVWNSRYRAAKRAGINPGEQMANVLFAGMRSVARLAERKANIEYLLENNPCSLLLIDGAGDLVEDTNDLEEAIECRIWIREITVKYKISVFSTLHPNPGGTKPRGHQGAEICREAESVALIKPAEDDSRVITTDFDFGKNRHNPKLATAFRWSDNLKMFVSADYDEMVASRKGEKDIQKRSLAEQVARGVLSGQAALRHVDLVTAIMDKTSQTEPTAKRKIKDMVGWKIIKKHTDGYYRVINNG